MNRFLAIALFMSVIFVASAQRAPFAGARPNGYKDRLQTDNANNANTDPNNNVIADRFGGNTNTGVAGTTERLPHLALGDREIVDRLNSFPVDQRPYWLVNAEAIEAQKNQGIRPGNPTNQNVASEIGNRFGGSSGSNTVTGNRPNYPAVVYPLEMTSNQQLQAQQMLNNQIQQALLNNNNNNNNAPLNSNPSSRRIVGQQTINNGPTQNPQPVQGRFPNSGYGR